MRVSEKNHNQSQEAIFYLLHDMYFLTCDVRCQAGHVSNSSSFLVKTPSCRGPNYRALVWAFMVARCLPKGCSI